MANTQSISPSQAKRFDQVGGIRGVDRTQVAALSEEAAYYCNLPLAEKGAALEEWALEQQERFERINSLVLLAIGQLQMLASNGRGDLVTLRVLQTINQDMLSDTREQHLMIEVASSLAAHAKGDVRT